jgi:hypothetical protein
MKYIVDLRDNDSFRKEHLVAKNNQFKIGNLPFATIDYNISAVISLLNGPDNIVYLVGNDNDIITLKNKYFKDNSRVIALGSLQNALITFSELRSSVRSFLELFFILILIIVFGFGLVVAINKFGKNYVLTNLALLNKTIK